MVYTHASYSAETIRVARRFLDCYGDDAYQCAVAMGQPVSVREFLYRLLESDR